MSLNPLPALLTLTFWPYYPIVTPLCSFVKQRQSELKFYTCTFNTKSIKQALHYYWLTAEGIRIGQVSQSCIGLFKFIQRKPSQVVNMLNQHSLPWNAVQWWHAMHMLWLSHNMSKMKIWRTCASMFNWESAPSVRPGWADGGSCVNIPLRSNCDLLVVTGTGQSYHSMRLHTVQLNENTSMLTCSQ